MDEIKANKFDDLKNIITDKINGRNSRIFLFYRANKAIKESVKICKSMVFSGKYDGLTVLSQDQGHWIGYKRAARDLNVNYKELKTDDGIVYVEKLKKDLETIKDELILFFVTQPAAYSFVQDLSEIHSVIKTFNQDNLSQGIKKRCILVADVSGSFSNKNQADFKNCDMMLASFAETKVVDLGYGGFLAVRENILDDVVEKTRYETDEKHKKRVSGLLLENFDEKWLDTAKEKLDSVEERLEKRYGLASKVKEDLKKRGFNVVKSNSLGANVIVESKDEEQQKRIIDFCKDNNFEYKECPMNIKINRLGLSIQLGNKR